MGEKVKVTTYDGKSISFPKLNTARERIDFIINNILEDELLAKYYNPSSEISIQGLNSNDYKEIEDRWLGIKIVGKPNKREHIKGFMDYLAGYILNAKDLSQKSNYKEFYNLAYKQDLTFEETERLNELKEKIIYADITKQGIDKSSILIRNCDLEQLMKDRLEDMIKMNNNSYTCKFMINDLKMRINRCQSIIEEVVELSSLINIQNKIIKNRLDSFKEKFKVVSDRNEIVELGKQYTNDKDLLKWYKLRVNELIDDYKLITELQQDVSR